MQCTEPQAEILTACMIGGDDANRAFNQSITLHLEGKLSVPFLQSAIDLLIGRHESLRTIFDIEGNSFTILKDLPVKLLVHMLETTDKNQKKAISNFLDSEALHVFDLRKGPLFKATLLKAGTLSHHLVLTLHHVVCDGWSLALLIKDIKMLYNSVANSQNTVMAEPMQFSEYAKQERAFIGSKAYSDMMAYWLKQFDGYISASGLPYDHPRPKLPAYKSGHISYPLSKELFTKVRETGKDNKCSVLVTMVSAFEILLYRISGHKQFVLGIPTAGQPAVGFDTMMGHCVHMLPVMARVDGKLKFSEYLDIRKTDYSEAFEHKRVTFGSILKTLKFNRDVSAVPMVPVTFNIDRPLVDDEDFYGLTTEMTINTREFSSFEMMMNLSRKEDELVIECDYNETLFEHSTVFNFLAKYEYLLEQLCSDNHIVLDAGFLHNVDELLTKLKSWNQTAADFPDKDTFYTLFEKTVKKFPDNTALVFKEISYSFTELNDQVNRLARYLVQSGLKRGDYAGVMLERGPYMLISLLAVMKTGAAYIPIDPDFPADRISYMLEDSRAGLLIASDANFHSCPTGTTLIHIDKALLESGDMESGNLDLPNDASDLAYLIYTSGSTGKPKGVLLEHKSLVNLLCSVQKRPGFGPEDKLLAVTTVSFDIAGLELYLPLISGGTLVLADSETVKDGGLLLQVINDENITVIQATPSTFKLMLANAWQGTPNLTLFCGGEALSKELAVKLIPKCKMLWNMYGPTETTIWSAIKQVSANDEIITIGNPIDNTEIYIMDEKMSLVPEGLTGEIFIAGAGLARGYLNRNELTAEKFVEHPLVPGKKIYRTGDLGKFLVNGEVLCLGRTDTQIKVRGFRIETGEIEYVVSTIDGIKESVVIAKELRQDDVRLIAFVVPESNENIRFTLARENKRIEMALVPREMETHWKAQAAADLPEYMVPSSFIFVKELPLTPNAKIDRKTLADIDVANILSDMLESGSKKSDNRDENEWTTQERLLKVIWEETLGIKNIQSNDNFFELGGHSLIGIELMSKVEKGLHLKLPLSSLFAYPTIAGLATFMENNEKPAWKYLVPVKPSGNKPPLYLVHGAGLEVMVFQELARYVDKEQPIYGIQAMGLISDEKPAASIEQIASNYLSEILVHNPDGPYALAGFSAGSVIAYEMARQLKAAGKRIYFLGNFDFSLENLERQIPMRKKLKKMILEFFPRQIYTIRNLFRHPSATIKFQKNFFRLRIMGILGRMGFESEEKELPGMERIFEIMDRYQEALGSYVVKPYNGSIDLFRSRVKLYYLKDKRYLGWEKYAEMGITIHPVQGDHDSMILQPHSEAFATKLQQVLDKNRTKHAK